MIQKMFGFLPNGEPSTVSEDRDPIYDTPPRAPRPIVTVDDPLPQTSAQSQAAVSTPAAPTVTTRPTPVARVRSARNTYADVFFTSPRLSRHNRVSLYNHKPQKNL